MWPYGIQFIFFLWKNWIFLSLELNHVSTLYQVRTSRIQTKGKNLRWKIIITIAREQWRTVCKELWEYFIWNVLSFSKEDNTCIFTPILVKFRFKHGEFKWLTQHHCKISNWEHWGSNPEYLLPNLMFFLFLPLKVNTIIWMYLAIFNNRKREAQRPTMWE